MNISSHQIISCVAVAAAALLTTAARADTYETTEVFRFPAASIESLKLDTVNGYIHCTGGSSNEVEITALFQIKAPTEADANAFRDSISIDITQPEKELVVKTRIPSSGGSFWSWIFGKRKEAVVNYQIALPANLAVDLESVNGQIKVDSVQGDLHLEAVNGAIRVKGAASARRIETVNGSIHIEFDTFAQTEAARIETVNGSVTVSLPSDAAFELHSSTVNGAIRCDFPLNEGFEQGRRSLKATVNGGNTPLRLETVNGSITVQSL
jgi:DUF4097 and DUF4098 domain-containing protein YvlB